MATVYWVGGAGTWDTTSTTHWSTSSGGAAGASAPTSADNVIIDTLSGTGNITCSSAVCNNFSVTATQAILLLSGTLSIYGNLTFVSGGSFTATNVVITFRATFSGKTISTGGKNLTNTTFDGIGGVWTQSSALTITNTTTLSNGTFNTSNFNFTTGSMTVPSGSSFNLNLGASTVSIAALTNLAGVGFSFNAGTSNLTMNGASSTTPLTFYNVTSTSSANFTGTFTFNNLTASASAGLYLKFSANPTINGTFTVNSVSTITSRMMLGSTNSTTITITAAAVSLTNVDIFNITGAGAASWSGTNLGNIGGNSNITFPAPKTVYWNLTGFVNWGSAGWALTSGGTPSINNFPLVQDTAIFNNAGAAGTVTIEAGYNLGSIDFSSRTTAMSFIWGNVTTGAIFGNFTLGSGVTLSTTRAFIFGPYTNQTITSNGVTFSGPITFNASTIGYSIGLTKLNGNLTSTGTLTITSGKLDLTNGGTGNYVFTASTLSAQSASNSSIAFGTGNITLTGSGVSLVSIQGAGFSFTGTPTLNINNNTATASSISITNFTETTSFNVNIISGTYTLSENPNNNYKNLNFTGFAGTFNNGVKTIYGNLTLSSSMTVGTSTSVTSFLATSGTQTITTNGKTLDFPLTFGSGTGTATYAVTGALTMGSTRALTFNNGTLRLTASTTNTVGSFVTIGTTLKYLTSSTPGTQATISQASGTVNATYLSVKDSNATGGTWSATALSNVNAGNNTGWIFTITNQGNFFLLF